MKLRADSFLVKGYSHAICEDYILHGNYSRGPYVILSDGCSSVPNTDVGARIICYAAQKYLHEAGKELIMPSRHDMVSKIMNRALISCEMLGIDKECLHATLLMMWGDGCGIQVHGWGDGACVIQYDDGTFEYLEVAFPNEMPKYPLYHVMPELERAYKQAAGESPTILSFDLKKKHGVLDGYFDNGLREHIVLDKVSTIKSISIMSDGITSFKDQVDLTKDVEDPKARAMELLQFKNTTGLFLQRRVNKMLKRWRRHDDPLDHYDDLSIGTIIMEGD